MKQSLRSPFFIKTIFTLSILSLFFAYRANAQTEASLNFDGTGDYVILKPFLSGGSYTKEVWIKLQTIDPGTHNIISENNSALYISANGYLAAGHNPGYNNVSDPDQLATGVWYHVAVTFDASTGRMRLYKNGAKIDSSIAPAYTNTAESRLGSIYTGSDGYFFEGNMDEVRIWNVVRTPEEIAADYLCNIIPGTTGLLAYYDFNDGIPDGNNVAKTTLIDVSGNGNNGTLYGFAKTGTTSNFVSDYPVLSGPCTVQPVNLVSFTATVNNNSAVYLKWQTASEMNNSGFSIQRSADGSSNWQEIGFVKGNGTSTVSHQYSFTDFSPLSGNSYYRLNQKDYDGNSSLSPVVVAVLSNSAKISLYPTITNGKLILSVSDNSLLNTSFLIMDNEGRVVMKDKISSGNQMIDVSNLQKGMYFLKMENGAAKKFIKQ